MLKTLLAKIGIEFLVIKPAVNHQSLYLKKIDNDKFITVDKTEMVKAKRETIEGIRRTELRDALSK